jgi:uncharacterized protein (DUF736 family)
MTTEFTAKFSLFPAKERKSEKSPDSTGSIEIPASELPALIRYLQDPANAQDDWQGNPAIKIRLAGWNATSKNGLQYVNGKVSPPMQQAPATSSVESLPF